MENSSQNVFNQNIRSFTPEIFEYSSSFGEYLDKADLIISHSGAGTILDVLRRGKPCVVVVNDTLLHNHQAELATAMNENGYLLSTICSELCATLDKLPTTHFNPLPKSHPELFGQYLDAIVP
ncbi:putative UDP-N-acetylglucosamine transferase subunit ALG13 like protein [Blattamonas nauphoetae]|uniref:UDP-N-acetylglucosamine transferase subunit ALG13 n=1 Tax=Blattamonas nauphoetae TaxID=2049346 RepID=A0ABQ9XEA2_9EUKA|nr:putative UDP-N-acetylglucosamine transferase subunit ALG13 like protein [Blattamonas nauphoetae]